MSELRDRWPRLVAAEARRVRALVVFALLAVVPAAVSTRRGADVEPPTPSCPDGVVRSPDGLRCRGASPGGADGAEVTGRAAWWMGTPLDLNRVTAADLTVVDGIGEALAARIVADRRARGRFERVADVRRVRGVGPTLAGRLAEVATVRPAASAPPR